MKKTKAQLDQEIAVALARDAASPTHGELGHIAGLVASENIDALRMARDNRLTLSQLRNVCAKAKQGDPVAVDRMIAIIARAERARKERVERRPERNRMSQSERDRHDRAEHAELEKIRLS